MMISRNSSSTQGAAGAKGMSLVELKAFFFSFFQRGGVTSCQLAPARVCQLMDDLPHESSVSTVKGLPSFSS